MKAYRSVAQLAAFAMVSLLMLAACGGGGGGSSTAATPGAAVSKGVITAKGSVFVNGIEFSTNGATIKIDDNPGLESDLKVGMIVKVKGASDDATKKGTAVEIEARDALEGTISSIDAANNTITVMGQTVRIEDNVTRLNDDDTVKVFASAAFAVGNVVEVNGFPDDQGGLRATRVAKKTSGELELKGFVTGLGASSFGLSLTPGGAATLTVNFSAGQLPAGLANGSLVEVKSNAAPSGGAITATLIKLEDALGAEGEKVEVEGIVSSGTLSSFVVNGQQVVTSSATQFEGGLSTDFAVGIKVEAEGPLNAGGAIEATKITFKSSIKLEGDASAISASGLTLLGKSVAINSFTRIDNGPLANGSHVEVRASLDRNGNLIASRIIVQSASTRAILQGPVSAFSAAAGTLTILNTAIATNGTTEFRISSDAADQAVTAAAFFGSLTANVSIVKVRWDNFTTLAAPAKQVEIELGK